MYPVHRFRDTPPKTKIRHNPPDLHIYRLDILIARGVPRKGCTRVHRYTPKRETYSRLSHPERRSIMEGKTVPNGTGAKVPSVTADTITTTGTPTSTREREVKRVADLASSPEDLLTRWSGAHVIEKISEGEWERMHAGSCSTCGKPGRKYAAGWACDDHSPRAVL